MRLVNRLALVAVLLVVTAGVASAAFTGPYYDTYVTVGGTKVDDVTLYVQDSTGDCNDTQITYLQFDVSSIAAVSDASLVFYRSSFSPIGISTDAAKPTKLSLYGVADFDKSTLTGSNAPLTQGLTPIQSIDIPATTAKFDAFTFGGANAGLKDYITTQLKSNNPPGDETVTLALSFSLNCGSQNTQMAFFSSRYTATAGYQPKLTINGMGTDAVELSRASAERPAPGWPLYAGLGAVALFVVAGVMISRRRRTA